MDMPASQLTIGATEFKARCLDILTRLSTRELRHVVVTRRGKPVAELIPPKEEKPRESIIGIFKDRIKVPPGVDLTEPTGSIDDWNAARGILYNE